MVGRPHSHYHYQPSHPLLPLYCAFVPGNTPYPTIQFLSTFCCFFLHDSSLSIPALLAVSTHPAVPPKIWVSPEAVQESGAAHLHLIREVAGHTHEHTNPHSCHAPFASLCCVTWSALQPPRWPYCFAERRLRTSIELFQTLHEADNTSAGVWWSNLATFPGRAFSGQRGWLCRL